MTDRMKLGEALYWLEMALSHERHMINPGQHSLTYWAEKAEECRLRSRALAKEARQGQFRLIRRAA